MQETQLKTSQPGRSGLEITRGAIAGFRRPGQVDPILAAAGLELTDEDVNEIEATK